MAEYAITGNREVVYKSGTSGPYWTYRAWGPVTTTVRDDAVTWSCVTHLTVAKTSNAPIAIISGTYKIWFPNSSGVSQMGATPVNVEPQTSAGDQSSPMGTPTGILPRTHSAYNVTFTLGLYGVTIQSYASSNMNASTLQAIYTCKDSKASVTITIPAKPSYSISYNANGGSGAPAAQTKWYGEALTLSSTKPTRSGYIFRGWSTNSSTATPTYSAGGSFTTNANTTLYAVWHRCPSCQSSVVSSYAPYYNGKASYAIDVNTVTIYDTSVASFSKLTLKLGSQQVTSSTAPSSGSPTRLSITPTYSGQYTPTLTITDSLGASTTTNLSQITINSYTAPSITTITAERVNATGQPSEEEVNENDPNNNPAIFGLLSVTFNVPSKTGYNCIEPTISISSGTHTITWYSNRNTETKIVNGTVNWANVTTGTTVYALISDCNTIASYNVSITPRDNRSSGSIRSVTIPQIFYTIDFLAGGRGIAFGSIATEEEFFCNMDVHFGKKLTFSNNGGIYYKGPQATYQMIRFIDNATDTYGNGISIGGGGLAVLGSGESTNTILNNLNLTSTGGTEATYIGSDGSIVFYPSIDSWKSSAAITMTAGRIWAGVNGDTTAENQVGVQSGAGQMCMYASAAVSGNRGVWLYAHGTGAAKSAFYADTNNNVVFNGSLTGNAATATKATQDGSGNTITSTYLKKTGADTMAGALTISSGGMNVTGNINLKPTSNAANTGSYIQCYNNGTDNYGCLGFMAKSTVSGKPPYFAFWTVSPGTNSGNTTGRFYITETSVYTSSSTPFTSAGKLTVSSGGAAITGAVTMSSTLTTTGDITSNGKGTFVGTGTTTSAANARVGTSSPIGRLMYNASSSRRYKHDIKDLSDEILNPEHLYNIKLRQFKYNSSYLDEGDERSETDVPGFIAEEMYEVYPIAVDLDGEGLPQDWNDRYVIPPMLALIQKQHVEIEQLKREIDELKNR